MLGALHFPLTASATELRRARSALVSRTQESAAALNGTRGDEQALLFGFFLLGCLRSTTDIAPALGDLFLDIRQHRPQMVLLRV